jgi:hypothetical protein
VTAPERSFFDLPRYLTSHFNSSARALALFFFCFSCSLGVSFCQAASSPTSVVWHLNTYWDKNTPERRSVDGSSIMRHNDLFIGDSALKRATLGTTACLTSLVQLLFSTTTTAAFSDSAARIRALVIPLFVLIRYCSYRKQSCILSMLLSAQSKARLRPTLWLLSTCER